MSLELNNTGITKIALPSIIYPDNKNNTFTIEVQNLQKFMSFDSEKQIIYIHQDAVTEAGYYTVTIVLIDSMGAKNEYTQVIEVNQPEK